jgi:L-alanine-DL-glutamate epimerase-like enolase superfamily enzyme
MQVTDVDVSTVTVERRFGFGDSTCSLVTLTAPTGATDVGETPDVEDPDSMPSDETIAAEPADFLVGRDPRRICAHRRDVRSRRVRPLPLSQFPATRRRRRRHPRAFDGLEHALERTGDDVDEVPTR